MGIDGRRPAAHGASALATVREEISVRRGTPPGPRALRWAGGCAGHRRAARLNSRIRVPRRAGSSWFANARFGPLPICRRALRAAYEPGARRPGRRPLERRPPDPGLRLVAGEPRPSHAGDEAPAQRAEIGAYEPVGDHGGEAYAGRLLRESEGEPCRRESELPVVGEGRCVAGRIPRHVPPRSRAAKLRLPVA